MKYLICFLSLMGMIHAQTFYPVPSNLDTSKLLLPSDLTYMGAFRLPADRAGSTNGFTYLLGSMTYSPHGDTAQDGYPGTLVITGHTSDRLTARVSIPAPVLSRNLAELPRATVIQPFIQFGIFPPHQQRVAGLEEVGDTTYVTMSDGYNTHGDQNLKIMGWGPRNLSSFGPMRMVGGESIHCFGDYLFYLPKWWSDKYAPGRFLAMGRHRWGDLCGQGPAIFAMNPHADSPDTLTRLSTVPMLRYLQYNNAAGEGGMPSYSRGGDYYAGAAFLESGRKSAIIMAGHKGLGGSVYGTYCSVQGFHDTAGYRPYFVLYNPDQLGQVAKGELASHLPQPYSGQDLHSIVVPSNSTTCHNYFIFALAYDRARNLLYGVQKHPGENPLVHAWKVKQYDTVAAPPPDTTPPVDTTCKRDTLRITDTLTVRDTVIQVDSTALSAVRDTLTFTRSLLFRVTGERDSLIAKGPDTVMVRDTVERLIYRDTIYNFQMDEAEIKIRRLMR